jgi:glycosyltransferase involved in cell wall biosynthesis
MITVQDCCRSDSERTGVRSEFQTAKEDVVIVQVGRMEPSKGHIVHLNALRVVSDLPGWTCWQVGGSQQPCELRYMRELKTTAFRLGIGDRVRFVGERSDVRRVLAAADIYCQPNVTPEGFGITFVEALCARLPVVTAAIGGALEVLNESCGLLLPANDPQQLANSLRRLIQDGALRKKLGEAGPARARQLCDPATQLQQLYQKLVTLLGDSHA